MCGIIGIVANHSVNQDIFDALTALQHRGQDAAGIATCNDRGRLYLSKGVGLVRDVIRTKEMFHLEGHYGIGHVRYPTAGSDSEQEAQPFYVNSPYGIVLAHNGNLINNASLRDDLLQHDRRHLNTHSDSEVLLNVLAHALQNLGTCELTPANIFQAVNAVQQRCLGAYTVVAVIAGVGLLAFRDAYGIRPLVYGKRSTDSGDEYMVASESVALDLLGYQLIDDVAPGEAIFINTQGELFKQQTIPAKQHAPCIFEYVYLARPDSLIDQVSVYKVRLRLGETLAEKIKRSWPEHDIEVVMPVPDTSRTAAAVLARRLGIKFREGLVKNRYIGRTFIMPGQQQREKSVRQKLNPIPLEFKDKNVLLVDDSIVRGTTAREIIQMTREAGARKVYFASAAPEIRHPNVYGIDIPATSELIAYENNVDTICQQLGADALIFQDLDDLQQAAREGNRAIERFEDSVFSGVYITGHVDDAYLEQWAKIRRG